MPGKPRQKHRHKNKGVKGTLINNNDITVRESPGKVRGFGDPGSEEAERWGRGLRSVGGAGGDTGFGLEGAWNKKKTGLASNT